MLPLPSSPDWTKARVQDHNNQLCLQVLHNEVALTSWQFIETQYKQLLLKQRMTVKQDTQLLQGFDNSRYQLHIICARVVPHGLQYLIILAYHSSPANGQVRWKMMYWMLHLHYFWLNMSVDIKQAVCQHAHCAFVNATKHQVSPPSHAMNYLMCCLSMCGLQVTSQGHEKNFKASTQWMAYDRIHHWCHHTSS